MPENVAHYFSSMPVTSVPAHKTPEARTITCMLSTRNKRRWNAGVDPFLFASLFTKVALSEKTDDAGCDGSERLKQILCIQGHSADAWSEGVGLDRLYGRAELDRETELLHGEDVANVEGMVRFGCCQAEDPSRTV